MIRPVSYAEILNAPNWPDLLAEYTTECSRLGKASPQPELYALLERSGGFQAFGVYDCDMLVGFAAVLIYVLPHFGKKIAATESIFMASAYRYIGHGLMGYIEQYARENECEEFLYSAPEGSRFDRVLSLSDGYQHTNNVYRRKL